MTCPLHRPQPPESVCLQNRREDRLIGRVGPCGRCGRVIKVTKEYPRGENKRQGISDPELLVGPGRKRRGAVGVPETGSAASPNVKGRGAKSPSPIKSKPHSVRFMSFAGGPAPSIVREVKKPVAVKAAPKSIPVYRCRNCGCKITALRKKKHGPWCDPCGAARERFKGSMEIMMKMKAMAEIKALRKAGKIRPGRPPGWRRAA